MRDVNVRGVRFAHVAIAALTLATFSSGARAQDAAPPESGQTQTSDPQSQSVNDPLHGSLPEYTVSPDPVDTEEPYIHWRTHSGTAAQCIASLRLSRSGGDQFVSALVVRCDGFILIPRSAYDLIRAGTPADIVVTGAEGETVAAPFPIAGFDHTVVDDHRVDYELLKVNGHHIRCLHLLAGYNVVPGDHVKIVYSVPIVTAKSSSCTSVTLNAIVGGTADKGMHFTLLSIQDSNGAAVLATTVPLGATVIDVETGAALGMVTSPGETVAFSSFKLFNNTFNEVGLAPSRSALKLLASAPAMDGSQDKYAAGTAPQAVRHVPGGPFTLKGLAHDQFLSDYHTDVVCTPDFQIDTYPVTIADFREWMQLPDVAAKLPEEWLPEEKTNPIRKQDLPVTGVLPDEASAYLERRDMRLPTEVEWQRAAKVTDLHWLQVITQQWMSLVAVGNDWVQNFLNYWRNMIANDRNAIASSKGQPPDTIFGAGESPQELEQYLRKTGQDLAASLGDFVKNNTLGRYIHPVNQYIEDFSVFGVRDVVLNAPELTLPHGSHERNGFKPFADAVDPYISWTKYIRQGGGGLDPSSVDYAPVEDFLYYYQITRTDVPAYYVLPQLAAGGSGKFEAKDIGVVGTGQAITPSGRNRNRIRISGPQVTNVSHSMSFEFHGFTYPEFRGAR